MAPQVQKRNCEGCNVCCIQPEIRSLGKPAGAVCARCDPGVGCRRWAERPVECRRFFCLWVTSDILPPALRPDRCGVVFEPLRDKPVLMALCDRPGAWRGPLAMQVIRAALTRGTSVIVIDGKERHMLLPEDGSVAKTRSDVEDVARSMGLI